LFRSLFANRQQPRTQILKPYPAPQRERKVHSPELTRALDANPLQAHRDRQVLAAITEKLRLLGRSDQPPPQCPRFHAPLIIELAEMRHRLLNDTPTNANAAHEAPITMRLPVLAYRRAAQIHGAESNRLAAARKGPRLALHAKIHSPQPLKSLILLCHCDKSTPQSAPQLRKLG